MGARVQIDITTAPRRVRKSNCRTISVRQLASSQGPCQSGYRPLRLRTMSGSRNRAGVQRRVSDDTPVRNRQRSRASRIALLHLFAALLCIARRALACKEGDADPPSQGDAPFDILIVNARVVDGAGNPWFRADVGVRGDRIAAVGRLSGRMRPPGPSTRATAWLRPASST